MYKNIVQRIPRKPGLFANKNLVFRAFLSANNIYKYQEGRNQTLGSLSTTRSVFYGPKTEYRNRPISKVDLLTFKKYNSINQHQSGNVAKNSLKNDKNDQNNYNTKNDKNNHNSKNANNSYNTKKNHFRWKKYGFVSGTFLALLLTLLLTDSTLILHLFLKCNNLVFREDNNHILLMNYLKNNYNLHGVSIQKNDNVKLNWATGFIEINDMELFVDEDDIFRIKSFKFNINLFKYFFDKSHMSIIDEVDIDGVRGKIDSEKLLTHPFSLKNKIKLKDCKLILNGNNSLKIFQLELHKISNQSFLLDLLNCEILSGEFNDSLFNIVERQSHLVNGKILQLNKDMEPSWEKISRLQMNKINIKKLHSAAFDWIYDGDIEFVLDVMIPKQHQDFEKEPKKNNSNNSYLVMDLAVKLYNPRCRVSSDTQNANVSMEQLQLIAETLNKNFPKQLQQNQQSNLQIYNETIVSSLPSKVLELDGLYDVKDDSNASSLYLTTNSSCDYIIPLNCKLLIDPAHFQFKEVCEKVTDEFYMELTRIAAKEELTNIDDNKKWEAIMVGLLAQVLILGLGTFN